LLICCIFSFVTGIDCRSRYFRKGLTFPSNIISFWCFLVQINLPHKGGVSSGFVWGFYFIISCFVKGIFQRVCLCFSNGSLLAHKKATREAWYCGRKEGETAGSDCSETEWAFQGLCVIAINYVVRVPLVLAVVF
jgi:hypothetical protein